MLKAEIKVWRDDTLMTSDYEGLNFEKKEGRVYKKIGVVSECNKGECNFYTKVKSNYSGKFLFLENLDGLILGEGETKKILIGENEDLSVSSFSVDGLIRNGNLFSRCGGVVTIIGYYYEEE